MYVHPKGLQRWKGETGAAEGGCNFGSFLIVTRAAWHCRSRKLNVFFPFLSRSWNNTYVRRNHPSCVTSKGIHCKGTIKSNDS